MPVEISCPREGNNTNVVVQGGGPSGNVCAVGQVNPSFAGVFVRVKVFAGHKSDGSDFPTDTNQDFTPDNTGTWRSPPYPYVPTSSPTTPYPELSMVAWEVVGSPPYNYYITHFYGSQASGYNCCGFRFGGSAMKASVALAPLVWKLTLAGFTPPLGQAFNRDWTLKLRDGTGETSIWTNGGDGTNEPNIELSCAGPPASAWRLVIRFGATALEYSAPLTWHAVGPLELIGVGGIDVPTTLSATPG